MTKENTQMKWYVVFDSLTGARLCKDGRLRTMANFGTFKSCVRVYKLWGAASNAVRKLNRSHDEKRFKVLPLANDESMDASGKIEKVDV